MAYRVRRWARGLPEKYRESLLIPDEEAEQFRNLRTLVSAGYLVHEPGTEVAPSAPVDAPAEDGPPCYGVDEERCDELRRLASQNVADLTDALDDLSKRELHVVYAAEQAGRQRQTAIIAIEAVLELFEDEEE